MTTQQGTGQQGYIAIAAYRPREGRAAELEALVREHIPILAAQGLVTSRASVAMRAKDGTIVEVFEWKSAAAIQLAHGNPAVSEMWARFNEVCTYEPLASLEESKQLFAGFAPVDLERGPA